jgi:hypothetical protein
MSILCMVVVMERSEVAGSMTSQPNPSVIDTDPLQVVSKGQDGT